MFVWKILRSSFGFLYVPKACSRGCSYTRGHQGTLRMTALRPIESSRVQGVPTGIYEANKLCAHPECADPVPDRGHHIFARSKIGNGLYFVQAWDENGKEMFPHPIPHVTGLCRAHHDAAEEHDAWIKLEDEGFVWYDRDSSEPFDVDGHGRWQRVGPLDPQPGGREKSHLRRRKRLEGDERRKRRRISIAVPADRENGGEVWDEILVLVKAKLVRLGLYSENDQIPNYEAITAALYDWAVLSDA